MDADPEYRPFQFTIADLLGLMVIVAVLGAASRLPRSDLHVIPLLAALYLLKLRILYFRVQPWLAFLLYLLVVAALLPYLYWRAIDWTNPTLRPVANWIGEPIITFTVSSVFFLYDILARRLSLKVYLIRSLLEIVVLIPVWAIGWLWFELLVLDWIDLGK